MDSNVQIALEHYLLAHADDELILAHRNSEWIGHAPILEEDIALANIAQDELGHATVWYALYGDLTDEDPDDLAFFRDAQNYRNVQMVELPKGDWAFTMMRQYLFDAYELTLLTQLQESSYRPLAEAIIKLRNEEIYHYKHTSTWIKRLGLGTEESHQRTQSALDTLWPYAQQLFVTLPDENLLVDVGIVSTTAVVHHKWLDITTKHLTDSGLTIPPNNQPPVTDRLDHTEHLITLLADMQKVARLDPEAVW